jgi:hypothetical protein
MKAQEPRYDRQRATNVVVISVMQAAEVNIPDLVCEYNEDAKIFQHGALSHHPEM